MFMAVRINVWEPLGWIMKAVVYNFLWLILNCKSDCCISIAHCKYIVVEGIN